MVRIQIKPAHGGAAGFTYNGLKALAEEYPENIRVEWIREEAKRC